MPAQKRPLLTPSLKIESKEFWKFLYYQLAISFDIDNFQICMQIIMIGSITGGNGKLFTNRMTFMELALVLSFVLMTCDL